MILRGEGVTVIEGTLFGDESDGVRIISTDPTEGTLNKNYTDLTINSGSTWTVGSETIIYISGKLQLDGDIVVSQKSNGGSAGSGSAGGGGAGGAGGNAGGCIYIFCKNFDGNGSITASGQDGGAGVNATLVSGSNAGSDGGDSDYNIYEEGVTAQVGLGGDRGLSGSSQAAGGTGHNLNTANALEDLKFILNDLLATQLMDILFSYGSGGGGGGGGNSRIGTGGQANGGGGGAGGSLGASSGNGGQGMAESLGGSAEGSGGGGGAGGGAGGQIILITRTNTGASTLTADGGDGGDGGDGADDRPQIGGGGGGGSGGIIITIANDMGFTHSVAGGASGAKGTGGTGSGGANGVAGTVGATINSIHPS